MKQHTKEKLSKSLKDARQNNPDSYNGRKHKEETKIKISESQKGIKSINYGKEVSAEVKEKISKGNRKFFKEHGDMRKHSNNPMAVVDVTLSGKIVELLKTHKPKEISLMFGISVGPIYEIKQGKYWTVRQS